MWRVLPFACLGGFICSFLFSCLDDFNFHLCSFGSPYPVLRFDTSRDSLLDSTLVGVVFVLVCSWKLFSLFLLDVLTIWDSGLSLLPNARGMIFAFAHLGGLVLSTFFGVPMANFSPSMMCDTWFACMLVA